MPPSSPCTWPNQAIKESGIVDSNIPRERIGHSHLPEFGGIGQHPGRPGHRRDGPEDRSFLAGRAALNPGIGPGSGKRIKAGYITVDDTTLLGRLNSTAGGFISNKFGFTGPCYSVSAACATSLVAIYSAIQMINNGILDAAVVGGGKKTCSRLTLSSFRPWGPWPAFPGSLAPRRRAAAPSTPPGTALSWGRAAA